MPGATHNQNLARQCASIFDPSSFMHKSYLRELSRPCFHLLNYMGRILLITLARSLAILNWRRNTRSLASDSPSLHASASVVYRRVGTLYKTIAEAPRTLHVLSRANSCNWSNCRLALILPLAYKLEKGLLAQVPKRTEPPYCNQSIRELCFYESSALKHKCSVTCSPANPSKACSE